MPRLRFRDRLYNRQVGRAMTSPLGILLAGGGLAVGLAAGLPIVVAGGLGAAAWAARVAVAMPRGLDLDGMDPFALADPWRSFVWRARRARKRYAEAVKTARHGPLRDRLEETGDRLETGVAECWRIAQSGEALTQARAQIDVAGINGQLTQLKWNTTGPPSAHRAETVAALESQLATAARLDGVIADTRDRLELLDVRLEEAVTRAVELAARGQRVDDFGSLVSDVDSVVSDMEALRIALDETDAPAAPAPPTAILPPGAPTTPTAIPPPAATPTPPMPPTPASSPSPGPATSPPVPPATSPPPASVPPAEPTA